MSAKAFGMSILAASILLTACGGGSKHSDPETPGANNGGTVEEVVDNRASSAVIATNYYTGDNIAAVEVIASWSINGERESYRALTGNDGKATILYPQEAESITLSSDAEGYAEFGRTYTVGDDDIYITLVPVHAVVAFNSSVENDLYVDGDILVELPAGAFTDASGNAFSGLVTAELTVIDPRNDPSLMPGQYEAIDGTTGQISSIESFGAINATFEDDSGNPLQLAAGQTATIRIPLAGDSSSSPATIPLFYYDDESGYWVEEGSATLTQIDGDWFYVGTVSHFTTWNADQVYNTVTITGCVANLDDSAAAGATVVSTGIDYTGTSSITTDASGNFTLPVRIGSELRIQAMGNGMLSESAQITSGAESTAPLESCLILKPVDISITLTWGENPDDLDSHLDGPDTDATNGRFHIYYGHEEQIVGNETIFLDVDDTESYGPEVIYLTGFPFDGVYNYSVDHYSGESNIQESPAFVELKIGNDRYTFNPPAGEPSECWQVFDITVTGGIATIDSVDTWGTSADCAGSSTASGDGEEPALPPIQAASVSGGIKPKAKYYAR